MDRNSQRDESIDKLLRKTFHAGRTADATFDACVGPEIIAAWAEGTLSARETDAVETHLASCTTCQQVLALLARTQPPAVVPRFSWSKWHLRWAVPIAAAATTVAIWVAVPDVARKPQIDDAFTTAAPQRAASDQQQPAAANPAGAELEKSEAARPPAAASSLEARADKQTRSAAAAASARESDANAPSAPARSEAAASPQQTRTLADASAELSRQRREAFAGPIEVASPDPLVRWRIMAPRILERTTNGGQTWEPIALPQAVDLTTVRAPGASTAIVSAVDGRQFRTDDQGRTWNPVQP